MNSEFIPMNVNIIQSYKKNLPSSSKIRYHKHALGHSRSTGRWTESVSDQSSPSGQTEIRIPRKAKTGSSCMNQWRSAPIQPIVLNFRYNRVEILLCPMIPNLFEFFIGFKLRFCSKNSLFITIRNTPSNTQHSFGLHIVGKLIFSSVLWFYFKWIG